MKELKHVFEGNLRGFTTEPRRDKEGQTYNLDIMVIDQGMETFRIPMRRKDADELREGLKNGEFLRVETLIRAFRDELGVSFLGLQPVALKGETKK